MFNQQFEPFSKKTTIAKYKRKVVDGRAVQDIGNLMDRDPEKGVSMKDWWEIPVLHPMAKERLGYPTQKPLALLERIIKASSNPGDIVLDPFCGCGTAIEAAQKLGRRWIGIDSSPIAIEMTRKRCSNSYKYY